MPVIPVINEEKLENIDKQIEKYLGQMDAISENQKKFTRYFTASEDKRKQKNLEQKIDQLLKEKDKLLSQKKKKDLKEQKEEDEIQESKKKYFKPKEIEDANQQKQEM